MNQGLRNETSILAGLATAGFLFKGNRNIAWGLGLLALGLRFLPQKKFSFQSKTVVITGGSRGLGLALAEALIAEGASVALLARDEEELKRAKNQLRESHQVNVLTIPCDITNRTRLKAAFQEILKSKGRIDVLINNAGSIAVGPFETMNQSDFEAQMNLHFYAVLKATQLILPIFKKQGEGRIVNISSIGGIVPVPHMVPYCASKFALAGFSQSLALELRKDKVYVTTVYPGLMRTGSPVQAVFKGDHEKEFAWFAYSDSTPGISVRPMQAAAEIIAAVEKEQTQLIISAPAKIGTWVHHNFPEVFNSVLSAVNNFLPKGTSQERKTGAQSQAWLEGQSWAKPQRNILKASQKRFNETEKSDANFNLNIKSNDSPR